MSRYLGIYLDATNSELAPGEIRVSYCDLPGAEMHHYTIPLTLVKSTQDQTDDEWIRDVLVAAIEVL